MAKKERRTVSANSIAENKARRSGAPVTAEFKPDYSYVKKDLTRIGILAGSFFLILVVLAFFLR
jgi:hypothetical protein